MNRQRPAPRAHPWVPKTHAVQPGAAVNIVLKADQPTGRTVAGTIQDVLTRGNHPRGIKVRLADGRVGRVQSMVGGGAASSGDPGGVVEGMRAVNLDDDDVSGSSGSRPREEAAGVVHEDGEGVPALQIGLEAYIKQAKPKRKGKGKAKQGTAAAAIGESTAPAPLAESSTTDSQPQQAAIPAADTATCPVCGEFEGDEAAVSHHVAGHFDSTS